MKFYGYCFLFLACFQQTPVFAQPPRQSAKRQEIDAKRMDADINSNDALPRSREFIRIDSTYYVGWMYEGIYKANHAADFLGYKNAIAPLVKAMRLLSRDYARQLRTRTSSLMTYYPAYRYQVDYTLIASQLMECYSNINQPQYAFAVVKEAEKWRFQRDYYFSVYAYLAWIVHRNRFYTSARYPFLKNSIPANEALANAYLDSGLVKIEQDKKLNATLFQPGYESIEKQTIYHYKAILYSYSLNIDSALKYYNLLRQGPLLSYNNYATFLSVCGDFREAEQNYSIASTQDAGDKRLQEWAYYSSILDIYKARPERGIQSMRDMIKAVGSTPGFGWYNIALARCELYNGNTVKSLHHATIAGQFKEVHIGTTLGQSHYDFSVNMIKLMNDIYSIQACKFENRNWWYNVLLWPRLTQLTTAKYLQQYLMVNQLALNPEREKVIYPLFSTESTVTWDEIWFLTRDFSTSFFYREFRHELQSDKRKLIRKYYRLFMARLEMKQGKYREAQSTLQDILRDTDIDYEYEKLFLARVYEALSTCADETGSRQQGMEDRYWMYLNFPQVVPYSDVIINMHLHITGPPDKELLSRLKDCRINWVADPALLAPRVSLTFSRGAGKKSVVYRVTDKNGNEIVKSQTYTYKNGEQAGLDIAYRLFKIEKDKETN